MFSGLSKESKKSCTQSTIREQRQRSEEESPGLGKPETVAIAALIQECEEYVKTEEFTKDLSSQILKMFMQERSKKLLNSDDLIDLPIHVSTESVVSRDSYYENGKHEESPDSAYDSVNYVHIPHGLTSKSSSLNHMLSDDEMSNASTIKNAKFSRDEITSISNYDTVLRLKELQIFLGQHSKQRITFHLFRLPNFPCTTLSLANCGLESRISRET